MKKILVTGGTGFIGSHTCVELITAGYDVHILDNLSNSSIDMVDRIEQITGVLPAFTKLDLRDKHSVSTFFANEKDIDGVIHFAALKSVGESVSHPLSYYENNLLGLINLLSTMYTAGVHNLVFSSSCTVYGSPETLPVTEDSPIGYTPAPYGASKQMCERIIEDFTASKNDFTATSLRYFNPTGAHPSQLIGELPTGIPNNLMPYITQTAAGLRSQLSVFGNDYNTPDGTAIRDYIHVCDLASAHVSAIRHLEESTENRHHKINVGTGNGYSVLEVIKSFERSTNMKLDYKFAPRREGDIESIYAQLDHAESLLKWKAKYTLDDMTKSAWNWEKKLRGID